MSPDSWSYSSPVILLPSCHSRRFLPLMRPRLASALLCSRVHGARPSFLSTLILLRMCNLEANGPHLTRTPRLAMLHSVWRRASKRQMEWRRRSAVALSRRLSWRATRRSVISATVAVSSSPTSWAHISALVTKSTSHWPLIPPAPGLNCIRKTSSPGGNRDLYQAPISYATQPKADKRGQLYVRAEVSAGRLGFSPSVCPAISCETISM